MNPLSVDTQTKAERFHIEQIRKAPVSKKLQLVASLIRTTRRLSWRGIRERYPGETEEQSVRRFLLLYGDETLSDRVTELWVQKRVAAK